MTKLNKILEKISFNKILSIVVTVLVLFIFVYFIKKNINDFSILKNISWFFIAILLLLELVGYFVQGFILKIILKCFKINLKFRDWFGLTVLTSTGNFFIPYSGLGFRAAYLKKKYNFNYTEFLSTLSATYIIQFIVYGLGGLISLWTISPRFALANHVLSIFLITTVLISIYLALFSTKIYTIKNKYLAKINIIVNGWQKIKQNPTLIKFLFVSTSVQFLLNAASFKFAYQSLNLHVSFMGAFLITSLSSFTILFRITPASLGFYEGIMVYTTKLLGIVGSSGFVVAEITRCVSFVWMVILGLYFSYIFIYRNKKNSEAVTIDLKGEEVDS